MGFCEHHTELSQEELSFMDVSSEIICASLFQVQASGRGTPSWLERGLSKISNSESPMGLSTQVLVINHGSPVQSLLSREHAGSCDTISTQSQSECNR